ncbi:DUF2997 domain-containing protein [Gloeobacter kilaueensis]|uniref:DUF2997 domain-containing protein n=1 Tax=Gloeobacter kilaueensis (strain ATCC BAA-2537 / CCAP 1431/1 / ULC 316 / JS1) TaxID=1183438 RepID=U5QG90_GLOK1|nr:DUF2997 domain-containing protein [Gloeobacter kilaueensis]AGY57982.1 hypothetical protein GKIL_1736 [Gloeobacter kilaueensis JS1]
MSNPNQPEIVIEIAPDGSVNLEALNFEGTACTETTAAYEQALGKVEARQFKPEYRRTHRRTNNTHRTQL